MQIKTLFIALLAVVLVSFSGKAYADNIGYVDLERVLISYDKAQTYQKDLQKKRADYQEFFLEKQKKLEKAKEKKKSEDSIKKMIEEMEMELKSRQEDLFKFEAQFQRTILAEVTGASQKVAKEYGIDIVVDKRVVYVGGFDLTEFVLNKLNE